MKEDYCSLFDHGFVHFYKTEVYDQVVDSEHTYIRIHVYSIQFEEEDQIVDS